MQIGVTHAILSLAGKVPVVRGNLIILGMTFEIFGNIALIVMVEILSKSIDVLFSKFLTMLHSSADVAGERKMILDRILLDTVNNCLD